jgi:hypothetical protein
MLPPGPSAQCPHPVRSPGSGTTLDREPVLLEDASAGSPSDMTAVTIHDPSAVIAVGFSTGEIVICDADAGTRIRSLCRLNPVMR